MKVGYDATGDLLSLSLGDDTQHQRFGGLGKQILASYGDDGRLVSLLIFDVKRHLPPGECLNDFVTPAGPTHP